MSAGLLGGHRSVREWPWWAAAVPCPPPASATTQLSERVDTNDEWIRSRTGIGARRVAGPDETLTSLAAEACSRALAHAGWSGRESLDLILLATSSPDDLFGTAPRVQAALGARQAVAFDLTAACSGFLFALITAAQYIRRRSVQPGAGDRRRSAQPLGRLGRSPHLRAVRRRGRSRGRGGLRRRRRRPAGLPDALRRQPQRLPHPRPDR